MDKPDLPPPKACPLLVQSHKKARYGTTLVADCMGDGQSGGEVYVSLCTGGDQAFTNCGHYTRAWFGINRERLQAALRDGKRLPTIVADEARHSLIPKPKKCDKKTE